MNTLPNLVFSKNACLIGENFVLRNKPEIYDISELSSAFFSALASDDAASFEYFCKKECSISDSSDSFRIYRLIDFHPFRFAIVEKCIVDGDTHNIVFLADDVSKFHMIMSPASEVLRDISYNLIKGLMFLSQSKDTASYMTPEAALAISHIPSVASSLCTEVKRTAYCDIGEVISRITAEFSEKHHYSDIKFDLLRDDCIIEVSPPPFIFVISAVISVLYTLSGDCVIFVDSHKFAHAGEIVISTSAAHSDNPNLQASGLSDLVASHTSLIGISQSANVVADLFNMALHASVIDSVITVTLIAGLDYQTEPDFKFSDPYSEVSSVTDEALSFFEIL